MLKPFAFLVLVFVLAPAALSQVTNCTEQPDGTACDDGNPCDGADTCTAGGCAGSTIVDDGVRLARLAPGDPTAVISWNLPPDATSSDIVRGLVSALPVSPTDTGEILLVQNSGSTSYQDSTVPAPDTCFWYLVRGRTACGGGPWGFQTQNGVATAQRQPHEGCVVDVNASARYLDRGLTVTDFKTCLEWEKKSQPGESAIHDVGNIYDWSTANGVWISSVNAESFAARTDWRVPTIAGCCGYSTGKRAELESIVDVSYFPTIDPIFGLTSVGNYWSSSVFGLFSWAGYVNFYFGEVGQFSRSSSYYVRAVRGGP